MHTKVYKVLDDEDVRQYIKFEMMKTFDSIKIPDDEDVRQYIKFEMMKTFDNI